MDVISKKVISNLQAKAGDLNEPGKIFKFIDTYETLMSRVMQQADSMSKNAKCGGCEGKVHKERVINRARDEAIRDTYDHSKSPDGLYVNEAGDLVRTPNTTKEVMVQPNLPGIYDEKENK